MTKININCNNIKYINSEILHDMMWPVMEIVNIILRKLICFRMVVIQSWLYYLYLLLLIKIIFCVW